MKKENFDYNKAPAVMYYVGDFVKHQKDYYGDRSVMFNPNKKDVELLNEEEFAEYKKTADKNFKFEKFNYNADAVKFRKMTASVMGAIYEGEQTGGFINVWNPQGNWSPFIMDDNYKM